MTHSNITEALKTLQKFRKGGDLVQANPFYDPTAPRPKPEEIPSQLQQLLHPYFVAAGLNRSRARLYLEEEPKDEDNVDILLTVMIVTAGKPGCQS